jgi:hypothetical protein
MQSMCAFSLVSLQVSGILVHPDPGRRKDRRHHHHVVLAVDPSCNRARFPSTISALSCLKFFYFSFFCFSHSEWLGRAIGGLGGEGVVIRLLFVLLCV